MQLHDTEIIVQTAGHIISTTHKKNNLQAIALSRENFFHL